MWTGLTEADCLIGGLKRNAILEWSFQEGQGFKL